MGLDVKGVVLVVSIVAAGARMCGNATHLSRANHPTLDRRLTSDGKRLHTDVAAASRSTGKRRRVRRRLLPLVVVRDGRMNSVLILVLSIIARTVGVLVTLLFAVLF